MPQQDRNRFIIIPPQPEPLVDWPGRDMRGPTLAEIISADDPRAVEQTPAAGPTNWMPELGIGARTRQPNGQPPRPRFGRMRGQAIDAGMDVAGEALEGAYEAPPGEELAGALRGGLEGGIQHSFGRAAGELVPGSGRLAEQQRELTRETAELSADLTLDGARGGGGDGPTASARDLLSDPYLALREGARRNGRTLSKDDYRAFEELDAATRRQMNAEERARVAREESHRAFEAAQRRSANPYLDEDYRYWRQQNDNALADVAAGDQMRAREREALERAEEQWRAGRREPPINRFPTKPGVGVVGSTTPSSSGRGGAGGAGYPVPRPSSPPPPVQPWPSPADPQTSWPVVSGRGRVGASQSPTRGRGGAGGPGY